MNIPEAHALAFEMLQQHGLTDVRLRWNRHRGRAGTASVFHGQRTITLSARAVKNWSDRQVVELILHEIAHHLVGIEHQHDKKWAAKLEELGAPALKFCPTYSTPSLVALASEDGRNPWMAFLGAVVGLLALWAFLPPVAAILTGFVVTWSLLSLAQAVWPPLPRKRRLEIEHAILHP